MPGDRTLACDGKVVRSLRRILAFSQPALAAKTRRRFLAGQSPDQCSLSTIKRIERGEAALNGKVEAVAAALGVPAVRLLSRACRARLSRDLAAIRAHEVVSLEAGPQQASAMTVRLTCEERFRKVLVDDHQLVIEGRMPAERYWKSFWYHQWDQFRYWREGVLDSATYLAWMPLRGREYRENASAGGIDYRAGWAAFTHWIEDGEFEGFMELVFRGDIDTAARPYAHLRTA